MTNNNNTTNYPLPDLHFSMASSSSSSPPLLPPTPYHHPQKLRKKRSKLIKIDPSLLLPNPIPNHNPNPNPNPHCLALCNTTQSHSSFSTPTRIRHCCPECPKHFGSEKALYGHMRCHPDRDYRGMNRKPPPPLPLSRYRISTSSPSSTSSLSIQEVEETAAVMMSFEDHEVAECLLLLSKTAILETDFGGGEGVSGGGGEGDYGGASCSFECSSCKKVFGSHQALGGHRASHKNVKGCVAINRSCEVFDLQDHQINYNNRNRDDNNVGVVVDDYNSSNDYTERSKEMAMMVLRHKCSICLRVFPSGQALGGHKRCHWEKGDQDNIASSSQGVNGNFAVSDGGKESTGLDLNLPAPTTNVEDESCSSYSSALTLDLRLGL